MNQIGHNYGYGTTNSTASASTQAVSSLSAANHINLQSGADTHLTSAQLNAGKAIDIAATGNLTIDAAKDSSQLDYPYNAKNKRDIIRNLDETVIASNLNAGKHISLTATGQKIEDGGQRTGFPLPNPLPEGEGASKGGKLTLNSANLNSQTGAVTLNAAQDVTIGTTAETHDHYAEHYTKTKSLLSRKSSLTIDQSQDTLAIGSSISGDTVTVNAGLPSTSGRGAGGEGEASATGNITITGSNVVATHDTTLNAQNNINISAAQETHNESHFTETKKSGFSSSGASISLGKSKLTTTSDTQSITNTASTVGSVQGNTNIKAGKTYTQTGSDILTPKGDINIAAQSVTIQNATDTNANQQTMQYKLSGITLAVTSPVISAIQTAQQMSKAASQTKDSRMQLLAAGTAALAANNAKDALGKVDQFGNIATAGSTGADDLTHVREANAADQVGGINVSLSIGSSKSSSETKQTSTTAASSHLNAGGDINITATGAGQDSNINVIGSQIKAYSDVTLKADHNINLQAAQNVDTLNSKSKGSSASIGVSFGTDGFLVTASASGSKGKAKGNGSTWTETVVQSGNNAGDKVTLNSGTDTNIIGAQVIGNQVIADVGTSGQGNLNIQSLQDRNQYTDKQQSVGGSISVGYGKMGGSINASKSSTKSNYASVNEQSGIMAGDGGFQVNVAGNTDLKGAVIASSDKAIKNNLNSLTTQTLTTANIENKAEYSAKGMSVSAGVGLNKQADGTFKNAPTASAGNSNLSDDRSSVTVSGISGGTVSITSPRPQAGEGQGEGLSGADQIAHLNRDVQTKLNTTTDAQGNTITTATAVDSAGHNLAGTLTPIFDKEQVQREINAQIQITQAFSQVAPKAVGDYASNQVKDLIRQAQEADIAGDKTKAAGLLAEAEKWNDGGVYRVALHTALGGLLTGDITGAASAGTVASAAPLLNTLQAQVQTQLEQAGISTSVAATISQGIAELTSVGIGSAIGGSAGAGVALAVDTNNRQLHPTEIDWIKANARAYARQLNNGKEPNAQQIRAAEEDLAQQAFRQVQFGVSGVWDVQAYEFLRAGTRSGAMLTADPNFPLSAPAPLFFASPQERANSAIYLSSALNNTSFYQNNQLSQPTITQINAGIADYTKKNNIAYNATIAAVALPTALLVGTVASAPTVVAAVSNFINTAIAACTGNLVLCINQAAIEAAGLIEGAPITTTIAAGATTKAAQEIKVAAEELQEATRLVRAVDSAKGAMPTLPTGMTSPEFGVLAGWGKKSQGAWDKLAIGYTDAEIQALKNAGVTRGDIESWKATYETIARLTVGNPQDTPIPRARLMQLIMEKW